MKKALITGITGQDGAYLADFLLRKGYKVYGIYRRTSTPNFWRMQALKILDKVTLIPADLTDLSSLIEAVKISNPDEIYNLGAQSYVSASFDQPLATNQINGIGPLMLLEIIRTRDKKIKFYQASTSELYGDSISPTGCQNEETPLIPNSPYALAKLTGFHAVKIYRDAYGIFACNGILFNHESPLRGLEFVTRKITNAVAKIKLGYETKLKLGNLDSKRDWGFAPDYVKVMWLMLQQEKPDDYVIATGEAHTVREFVEEAFNAVGLDWKKYVKCDQILKRPVDVPHLRGDYSKAKKVLGWEPKVRFKQLVDIMVKADMDRWKRFKKGEKFHWDAFNSLEDTEILQRKRKS